MSVRSPKQVYHRDCVTRDKKAGFKFNPCSPQYWKQVNEEFAEGVRRGGYVHNMFAHHGLRCLVTQIDFPWALRVDMSKADEDGDFRLSQLEFPPGVTPMETNRGRQIGDFLLARVKRIRG